MSTFLFQQMRRVGYRLVGQYPRDRPSQNTHLESGTPGGNLREALEGLASLDDSAAFEILVAAEHGRDSEIRAVAIGTFGRSHAAAATDLLIAIQIIKEGQAAPPTRYAHCSGKSFPMPTRNMNG